MAASLGFTTYGHGPKRVVVLHDWFCDHTTWDSMLPYVTPEHFTYAFVDLRGYGASKDIEGSYTLEEAAGDVIAVAERLGWTRFSLIGHSMSGLVVQRILQIVPTQIERVVAVTPAPPGGLAMEPDAAAFFRSIAMASDEERFRLLGSMWGQRLSESWTRFKLRRWRETVSPAAAAAYVDLWGGTDITANAHGIVTPILIVAAADDAPPFQAGALEKSMLPYYPNGTVISLGESGHYPMQEQPPMLATVIERFLRK